MKDTHIDLEQLKARALRYHESSQPLVRGRMVPTLNGGMVYLGPEEAEAPRAVLIKVQTAEGLTVPLQRGGRYLLDLVDRWQEEVSSELQAEGFTFSPLKSVAPGSLRARDEAGKLLVVAEKEGRFYSKTPVASIQYRPRLKMILADYAKRLEAETFLTQLEMSFQETIE